MKTLLGSAWDLPALEQQLKDEQLHWHDALVVTAAYRPQLAEIPLDHWAAYTEALRATLVRATGPEPVIRVLSLPWQDAARDAPLHWGCLFGNRVRAVAEIAESVLTPDQQALPLRLQGPVMHKEWIGPAFSGQTYLRWRTRSPASSAPPGASDRSGVEDGGGLGRDRAVNGAVVGESITLPSASEKTRALPAGTVNIGALRRRSWRTGPTAEPPGD